MNSDRTLDLAIAQEVFQYEIGSVGSKSKVNSPGGCGTYGCEKLHWKDLQNYSENMEDTQELIEKLTSLEFSVDVSSYPKSRKWLTPPYKNAKVSEWVMTEGRHPYQCTICEYDLSLDAWIVVCDETANTPSEAVCLAALKAMRRET